MPRGCQFGVLLLLLLVVALVTVMGGSESSGRRVSFGLDEEEQVRVLRGVRLSDDIVNRMKESAWQREEQNKTPGTTSTAQAVPPRGESASEAKGPQQPTAGGSKPTTYAEDELYRRYEKEQAIIQEELARIARREREAAQEQYSSAILREKNYTNQERRRAEHLPADLDEWAKELQRKEEELKKLDAFHKEQLASIEKKEPQVEKKSPLQESTEKDSSAPRTALLSEALPCAVKENAALTLRDPEQRRKNLEIYKMTAEQFHTAATNAEFQVKKRSYDPVCMNLQSGILKCYAENRQELLNCSDLAKEYRSCVREAQKNLLFNHG